MWNKVHDRHSHKIPDQKLFQISEMSWLTITGNIWYNHNFLIAVGNNVQVLFSYLIDYIDHLMLLLLPVFIFKK